jgi:fumarate reductase flavoprotein subunit
MPEVPETPEDKLPGLEKAMRRLQVAKDFVEIFDSWDKLAGWMGLDSAVLRTEIDNYNADCDRGRDSLFAKDRKYLMPLRTPPYYVIRWGASIINTIGGIKINERTEVLDGRDNPIPGLYAAGVDSGGWESPTYCWLISGHAFGFSVYSGRIAGENAALFVKGK